VCSGSHNDCLDSHGSVLSLMSWCNKSIYASASSSFRTRASTSSHFIASYRISLRRKTILRSCYYRPIWAARSRSVAGPCCCIQRCVQGKRVWLHFFALLSIGTAAQKGLHLLFQTNLLFHQHCVSGLLFPRPFFAGLARTDFSTPRCTTPP
jgi:hypothetical protein